MNIDCNVRKKRALRRSVSRDILFRFDIGNPNLQRKHGYFSKLSLHALKLNRCAVRLLGNLLQVRRDSSPPADS